MAASNSISYFTTKTFDNALKNVLLQGGQGSKRANKVSAILYNLRNGGDPFHGLPVTNNGENRIPHAVKYDLGDHWRLVTQQNDKYCIFLFIGNHNETEDWLNVKKGQRTAVRDSELILIHGAGEPVIRERAPKAAHHYQSLAERLDQDAMDHVFADVPRSIAKKLEALDAHSTTAELQTLISGLPEKSAELIFVVFNLLLQGNYDAAQARIDYSMGRTKDLTLLGAEELLKVKNGEEVRLLRIGSTEYEQWMRAFEKRTDWHDWFLYLHPEQEKVVDATYQGSAQLSGVSGSGKTCVVVRRAIRLAEKSSSKVLLVTLNRSLAGLLGKLVDLACVDETTRSRISVTSFFELAQNLLFKFEPENKKHYEIVTWKHGEHVDLVFREFYRQWLNNNSAKVLLGLHHSLTARGISGEGYLREEFDWIRSAISPDNRQHYLKLERKGRKFPILPDRRANVLAGLIGWEEKMRAVGVIDYLGLTAALSRHISELEPAYTNILLDEAQDFGTTELSIIRKLVPHGENDIFLCGDVAQTILPKHRSLTAAGIENITRERISKNYRNSREILKAAYEVLKKNITEEMLDSDDLEILDPKFANFSGPIPMALLAETLEEEIAYARSYAKTSLANGRRSVCIAFSGFSSRDVKIFADRIGVAALDGTYDPKKEPIVFSDLEQAKGYEFDVLIILNCRNEILPPKDAPEEEAHRACCKLYVAMTRAKYELILSFHNVASPWIVDVRDTIGTDFWSELENADPELMQGVPEMLPEFDPDQKLNDLGSLTGLQFIYSSAGLGLSVTAQEKLIEVVDGRGLISSVAGVSRRLRWPNMQSLTKDLKQTRRSDHILGPNVAEEIRNYTRDIS